MTVEAPFSGQVIPFVNENLPPLRAPEQDRSVFGVVLAGPGLEGNDIVTLSGQHSKDEIVPARRVGKIAPLPFANAQSFVEPSPRRTR